MSMRRRPAMAPVGFGVQRHTQRRGVFHDRTDGLRGLIDFVVRRLYAELLSLKKDS